MFLKSFTDALLHLLGTLMGQAAGSLVYDILKEIWHYIYIDAENGYFKDHPEDTDKENTAENIIKRFKTVVEEKGYEVQSS